MEHCAICKNHIMDKCIDCEEKKEGKEGKVSCPQQWGKCGHAYHEHCISQWVKSKQLCPLDNKPWEKQDK